MMIPIAIAAKELKKLPPEIIKRILVAVESLSENPLPDGAKKLVGSHPTYRIREGSYRIIYNLLSDVVVIEIIKVGHRKDAYRQWSAIRQNNPFVQFIIREFAELYRS